MKNLKKIFSNSMAAKRTVRRAILLILITAFIMTGCASQTGWTPTVDPYNNQNAGNLSRDNYECRQLANRAAGDTAVKTGQGALLGGALGAAMGAAIGAAVGAPGAGAAIGAATGGFGGGMQQGFQAEEVYKRAYKTCLRNRGHNVIY